MSGQPVRAFDLVRKRLKEREQLLYVVFFLVDGGRVVGLNLPHFVLEDVIAELKTELFPRCIVLNQ